MNFAIGAFRVPPFLLPIYQAAGIDFGIPWQVLAAINEVETDYGRNLSTSPAGAIGWMQFLPSTWAKYGMDADGDGKSNPYDPVDAIFAAGRYLHAAGARRNLRGAIFAYNHALWYVASVTLRARLLETMPATLVDALTGLMQARFPVGGHLGRFASRPATLTRVGGKLAVALSAPAGAPVIAVADGHVVHIGENAAQGRYVTLEDAYGNRFTYTGLGSLEATYPVVKPSWESAGQIAKELHPPAVRAGNASHPVLPAKIELPSTTTPHKGGATHAARPPARPLVKERLFAHPRRRASFAAGGKLQVRALRAGSSPFAGQQLLGVTGPSDDFSQALQLPTADYELAPLRKGSGVVAGTVLGRVARTTAGAPSRVVLMVRPAGAAAPVDVRPVVAGWELLGKLTAGRRGRGRQRRPSLFGGRDPSLGQLLLVNKTELERRVLADPRATIYSCGRRDIEAGLVDRRVLAVIEYLSHSGFAPGVSRLVCGRRRQPGDPTGAAVEITRLDGAPVAGHQQDGGTVDLAIRRLLALQGVLAPARIVSLRSYPGEPSAIALPDHAGKLEIDFDTSVPGVPSTGGDRLATAQWRRLMSRLAALSGQGDTLTSSP